MKGFASKSLAEAAPNGGVFLNAFDTFLTDLYGKNGYRAVSRIPFDEDVMRDSIGDEATEAFILSDELHEVFFFGITEKELSIHDTRDTMVIS